MTGLHRSNKLKTVLLPKVVHSISRGTWLGKLNAVSLWIPLTYQWDPGSAPSGLCRFLCNGCLGSCSSPASPFGHISVWGYWKTIHSLSFNPHQKQKLAPSFLSTALQETSQDWILQPWRLVKWVTLLVLRSLKCLIGFAFQEEILELKSFLSTWSH